ncbi:tetratricopeptide repeat protein [Fimbriimonas ginsengisoli]|uniref:TPR repeat-containing protein n=1 Tax=Fimbriimonas ginsengisoli Gsoil 348 TaxID=661478 RepID=A0A068NZ11_FIMGI|nr:tetratricopeptide repeat protein [Fimbriimonas ginsengisoli]AIE87764.1 TPR repeat-containing protein [Fimbriimonas ginsengisoli Gsoil 348]
MNDPADRVRFYISQQRYQEALKELATAIAQRPQDAELHALRSHCLIQVDHREAIKAAELAVSLEPDLAFAHYMLAAARDSAGKPKQAEPAARQALALRPEWPDGYAMLAGVLARQAKWPDALAQAEEGLRVDPNHEGCQRQRAQALSFMGKDAEAKEAVLKALVDNPGSPRVHAEMGWVSLRAGNYREAEAHFQEALRIDPTNERARLGLLDALRARFILYRALLGFAALLRALPAKYQGSVGFILFLIIRGAGEILASNHGLAPVLVPILVILGTMFLMRWIGRPVANLSLLFHPLGRLALGREQRIETWTMAGFLAAGVLLGVGGWFSPLKVWPAGVMAAVGWMLLTLASAMETRQNRRVFFWSLAVFSAILVVIATYASIVSPPKL